MDKSRNPATLKQLKHEVETGVAQLALALEDVIVAPRDQSPDLARLQETVAAFPPLAPTLRQLQLGHLALLANELLLLLQDTLRPDASVDRHECSLRLESAFVAATDFPALLEHALRQGADSFELVCRLLNRLRKARGCAAILAASVLQKNEDVSFGKLFAEQPERMRGLVTKQVGQLQAASAALAGNPDDAQALKAITVISENLELISRDHKSGVVWGLARALAGSCSSGQGDRVALAACLDALQAHAQALLSAGAAQPAVDEPGLERLLDLVAASASSEGRIVAARLWYHLDSGMTREQRAGHRDLQVGYWSKSAIAKCLLLVGDESRALLEQINALAEAPAGNREGVRGLYEAIRRSGEVMRMLGMQHLVDLVDSSLPLLPGEPLEDVLHRAAALLHRVNAEIDSKLARMEREVVGDPMALGSWERVNASEARLLQSAVQLLDAAIAAVAAPAATAGDMQSAREKLEVLAAVLGTVQRTEEARQLALAIAWLDWAREQPAAAPAVEPAQHLLPLLAGILATLERLLYGWAAAASGEGDATAGHAAALAGFLQAQRAQAPAVPGTRLMVVPVVPAINDEDTKLPEPCAAAANSIPAEPEPEPVDEALLAVFLEEADELLQALDALYLRWSASPADRSCMDEYLRALHTLKGSAALVGEHALSRLAHEYEAFVVEQRQSGRGFDATFFQGCDTRLHALHEVCTRYGRNAEGHIVQAQAAERPPELPEASAEPAPALVAEPAPALLQRSPGPAAAPAPDELIRVSGKLLEALLNDADEISFARSKVETGISEVSALLLELDATLSRFRNCVTALDDQASRHAVARTDAPLRPGSAGPGQEFDALELDRYTGLQELAVALAENVSDLQDVRANLGTRAREIGQVLAGQQRLANSLQDGLILTQMVPFASVVPRLRRLVRQIGGMLGKPVRLEVENRQGSVDRSMLQALVTPLEHILRNAIDHGIETAELRRQLGKPEEATLRITVARHGASVRIEITDDGQGIDVEKVRQRAVGSGLLEEGVVISAADAYRLLFRSGFSTAAAVSSISGRGVGLDVVRSELAQIGGVVAIESAAGCGTTFILTLPLTSSLNRALVFTLQDTRYVVLMNTLDGVIVDLLANIHRMQQEGAPLYEYGGTHYRYLYLGKLIDESLKPRLESIDSSVSLLLVSSPAGNYALHIDAVVESRDLVVKTLGQQFAAMPGIAGGVILPDGNVAIVLDLKALLATLDRDAPAQPAPLQLTPRGSGERQRKLVMVVDDSVTVRKATTAMLKRHGMDVVTARNGLEAVEMLGTTVPDLILLDIEMPQMDGFEVASYVRAHAAPVRDIPIIMITSRIGEKHRSRAEAIGVNEYLCKPFKEDSLLASIREY